MSSPRDEFVRLGELYIKHYGSEYTFPGVPDYREARLGRLRCLMVLGELEVSYLRPCAAHYEPVFSNGQFRCEDWYVHLEALRNRLILERLADV